MVGTRNKLFVPNFTFQWTFGDFYSTVLNLVLEKEVFWFKPVRKSALLRVIERKKVLAGAGTEPATSLPLG